MEKEKQNGEKPEEEPDLSKTVPITPQEEQKLAGFLNKVKAARGNFGGYAQQVVHRTTAPFLLIYNRKLQMNKKVAAHVLARYKLGQLLGSGAYGYVWRVEERSTGRKVALKKIFGAFRDSTDAQRTYRQVQILKGLRHRSVVGLLEVLGGGKGDLYLVMELMEADLQAVVGNILGHSHLIYLLFQLLRVTAYLHKKELLHRDLKPSNILIDSNCNLKVCDFGLARSLHQSKQEQNILTQEVATKWYRSPELLLGSRHYYYPVDCWSIGCIAAELLTGRPLFAGNSTLEQLQLMIAYSGKLSKEDVDALDSPVAECLIAQIKSKKRSFADYFGLIDSSFHPLLQGLLQFNPNKRLTAEQCLQLDIFSDLVDEYGKEDYQADLRPLQLMLDQNHKFSLAKYRQEVYRGISKELRGISESRLSNRGKGGSKQRSKSRSQSMSKKNTAQKSHHKPGKVSIDHLKKKQRKDTLQNQGKKSAPKSLSSKSGVKPVKTLNSPNKTQLLKGVKSPGTDKLRKKGGLLIGYGRPKFV